MMDASSQSGRTPNKWGCRLRSRTPKRWGVGGPEKETTRAPAAHGAAPQAAPFGASQGAPPAGGLTAMTANMPDAAWRSMWQSGGGGAKEESRRGRGEGGARQRLVYA
jgi:hypothetical protein